MGDEKSQSIKYVNHSELSYNLTDIPRLLPVHHFTFFDTNLITKRMKCKLYQDANECRELEEMRCLAKGKTTVEYEECMIKLYINDKAITVEPSIFCENHYADMTLWVDKLHPDLLPYWIRKHGCLSIAGVDRGK